MLVRTLLVLHLAFFCVHGLDFKLRYNKQSSMTCAAKITYDAGSIKCGVRCTEKYKDMCRGFVATGSTCQLCMVCQANDQQLVFTGNVLVAELFTDDIMHGKISYF